MLKLIAVFLLMAMLISGTMQGQVLSDSSRNSQNNLREVIARETEKHNGESVTVDAKKMDKMQRQTPPKNWDTKSTLIITGIIVVLVGLAVVLAYNSKRCIRRSPSGCSFTDDINCECTEYAK